MRLLLGRSDTVVRGKRLVHSDSRIIPRRCLARWTHRCAAKCARRTSVENGGDCRSSSLPVRSPNAFLILPLVLSMIVAQRRRRTRDQQEGQRRFESKTRLVPDPAGFV